MFTYRYIRRTYVPSFSDSVEFQQNKSKSIKIVQLTPIKIAINSAFQHFS